MTIQLSGFRELDAVLRRLPEDMHREYLEDAVRAGGAILRYEAALRAPKESGDLAESITLRVTRQRNTGGDPRAEIGPSKKEQHVGRFQEFGTARHGAQPFLRPALDAKGQEAATIMGESLRRSMERLKP